MQIGSPVTCKRCCPKDSYSLESNIPLLEWAEACTFGSKQVVEDPLQDPMKEKDVWIVLSIGENWYRQILLSISPGNLLRTVNKSHLIALKTTKFYFLFLMKQFFYLYSSTMFEVKDFSPCCFTKTVKSPYGWFSIKRQFWYRAEGVAGSIPLSYKCVSLCHLRLQPFQFVLISLCPCKIHVGYFRIQAAVAIRISNQNNSLARAFDCCYLQLLNYLYSVVKVHETKDHWLESQSWIRVLTLT